MRWFEPTDPGPPESETPVKASGPSTQALCTWLDTGYIQLLATRQGPYVECNQIVTKEPFMMGQVKEGIYGLASDTKAINLKCLG